VRFQGGNITTITAAVSLVISLVGLGISIVALRFTNEQARGYLFPVPTIYMDPRLSAVMLRNFGPGAMLSVSSEVNIVGPGQAATKFTHYHPSLAQSEAAVLLPPEIVSTTAIAILNATVAYENIKRERKTEVFRLTSDQLVVGEY
jgi:hypothetical protein